MIEGLERQTTVKYTKNENILMKDLRSVWFQDLEEIGDVYEIEMRKRQVVINRPFQVGIAVYQMAKLQILQFYYDCLDRYLDRRDFELMRMDTDSLYFGLSKKKKHQKRLFDWKCGRNLKRGKKNGLPGTNGAEESRGCLSSSLREREASLYEANVIL